MTKTIWCSFVNAAYFLLWSWLVVVAPVESLSSRTHLKILTKNYLGFDFHKPGTFPHPLLPPHPFLPLHHQGLHPSPPPPHSGNFCTVTSVTFSLWFSNSMFWTNFSNFWSVFYSNIPKYLLVLCRVASRISCKPFPVSWLPCHQVHQYIPSIAHVITRLLCTCCQSLLPVYPVPVVSLPCTCCTSTLDLLPVYPILSFALWTVSQSYYQC